MDEHYHFIGIGGIGMSALARILLDQKYSISGSDLKLSSQLQDLSHRGACLYSGHSKDHMPPSGAVVYSSSIHDTNPEFKIAREQGRKLLHRSELLAELSKGKKALAVTGTHGKTTVTALLSFVMMAAGEDPSFAIGGMLDFKDFFPEPLNGRAGAGETFILEADESDGSFLNYHPYGAIITNIEPDHLDYYGTTQQMEEAYTAFAQKVQSQNHLFYYGDDPNVEKVLGKRGRSYGFKEGNALHISRDKQDGWGQTFTLSYQDKEYKDIYINLIGRHNILNAAAVFGMLLEWGLPEEKIRKGFTLFPSVHRRCERRGEAGNILFIDDYAHHPTEIKATLAAIHEAVYPRRLLVIFEPHRFSRICALFDDFTHAFELADALFVTDIYGAGEKPIEGMSSKLLVSKIQERSKVSCSYLSKDNVSEVIYRKAFAGDAVVTLGAGDVTHLHKSLIPYFEKMPTKKMRVGLIFGGRSGEHEVSLMSARSVGPCIDSDLFDSSFFSIDKAGRWSMEKRIECSLSNGPTLAPEVMESLMGCDIFLPILHGPYGEDGAVQGFFETLGKPYAGAGYLACALAMDKVLSKKLAALEGVPILPYLACHYFTWEKERKAVVEQIISTLELPIFVKPIHLGSTLGVSKVEKWDDLEKAIDAAFALDKEIIIEKGIDHPREIEFALLGDSQIYFRTPLPGELKTEGAIYDYEGKYGAHAIGVELYPDLSASAQAQGVFYAEKVYKALKCEGMARVDFFLDKEGSLWFNEVNPIPGFTINSMYPKIWQREGLSLKELVTRLIYLGLKKSSRD